MPGRPISERSSGAGPTATPEWRTGHSHRVLKAEPQPQRSPAVNEPMRLKTIQIVAALTAALSFVLAFIAAGIFIVSVAFMAIGMAILAWLASSLMKHIRALSRRRVAGTRVANRP